ncbi:RHS repeat-associated core domain-containing protein [Pseudomonas sp. GL-B-19]|uniref:RHS repeat-associated core domain-containing protein n=1 Tax=Pseudomonas sp. GL-B-19 TaxID=2832393 RepID=UPI001CBB61DE|nr:RHS repeat-associated core domain-containing protein [Pseudomonas sp. GL-B-19]
MAGQPLLWDGRNQLQRVTQVQRSGPDDDEEHYQYDGSGARVRKTTVSHTSGTARRAQVIYLPGLELRRTESTQGSSTRLEEELQVISVGSAGRQQVRVLHWEAGKPDDIPNDQSRGSLDNQIGSSLLELDQHADILTQEEYYPFGGTAVWSGKNASETKYKFVRYSGKERDATGLYYYGFRYYAPWLGRWLNPDPAGTVDGLNLFCMVRNNPIRFVDESGLFTVDDILNGELGIDEESLRQAFNTDGAWTELVSILKSTYPDLPNHEFDEFTSDATNWFTTSGQLSGIASSENNPSESGTLDETDVTDVSPLNSFHQEIRNSLRIEEGEFIFRGDLRSPDEIFKEGFTPRGRSDDLTEYVHSNTDSIYVGFSKKEKIARIYANQKDVGGYLYVVKRQGHHIDINSELKKPGRWPAGEYRFYEYAEEISVPGGVKPAEVIKAYPVSDKKKYTASAIYNPYVEN